MGFSYGNGLRAAKPELVEHLATGIRAYVRNEIARAVLIAVTFHRRNRIDDRLFRGDLERGAHTHSRPCSVGQVDKRRLDLATSDVVEALPHILRVDVLGFQAAPQSGLLQRSLR